MKRLSILILLVVFCAVSISYAENTASSIAEGDKFWANRDNQSSLKKSIAAYEKALAETPDSEDLLVRLSIAYYWKGNNMPASSKDGRKAAYQRGMEYAQKVIDKKPSSRGGNFWFATNKASYGREQGILKSKKYLPDLEAKMKIVQDQEEFYFYGGPQRFLSRIIYKAPRFLRKAFGYDLKEAESMLKAAIAKYPKFSMTYLFIADIYTEMKRPDDAKAALQKVLAMPQNIMPGYEAVVRRDQKIAKAKLQEIQSGE